MPVKAKVSIGITPLDTWGSMAQNGNTNQLSGNKLLPSEHLGHARASRPKRTNLLAASIVESGKDKAPYRMGATVHAAIKEQKMRIAKIGKDGLSHVYAQKTLAKNGNYFYQVLHGEQGRGRWQVQIPLFSRDFPADASSPTQLDLSGVDLSLRALNDRKDARGNQMFAIGKGGKDEKQLILWSLSPGFRGGATYEVAGAARVIAEGYEAQGDAGRMGGAPCPMVLVEGPCALKWVRTGRLYGDPAEWVAEFDGQNWKVAPQEEKLIEDAAFSEEIENLPEFRP